ncbi:MAG: HAD family hydrolase [Pseudomonadales bacterium]|jgi:HAD superfamily hydrolase (TIGR01490 family)|tara:strand:+ start:1074 stop:1730 length:657 start_codon:yes stop_codon:yes gene_type:complete
MPLTIFDLDETLIAADSDHEWGQFVVDKGLVDAQKHKKKNDDFYEQYKAGQLDIDEYLQFSCSVLTQYSIEDLHRFRSEFVAQRILPIILDKAQDLVKKHRELGDTLLVITSTMEFVTRPIVDEFGIDILIAPDPEIVSNRYTGRIVGVPSFAAGKVTRLEQWLANRQDSLEGSSFYSDSHNDLPLLRLVDNPVAVDPDPILREKAEENQWPIISLRD